MSGVPDRYGSDGQFASDKDQPERGLVLMRDIVKRYNATLALAGVSFEVRAGEIHALLGENGAGKSTLMHVLSGLTRPDSGEITLDGRRIAIDSPRAARAHSIAMVHQHFTLVPAFTVQENLALDRPDVIGRWNYSPAAAAAPALERATTFGWELHADARVEDLPVGLQQRVEIIKALSTGARIVIFDEPTAVLTPEEVENLFDVLRRLRDEGKAIILIAHKLAEILAVADRVTVLRRGRNEATVDVRKTTARQLANWMIGAQLEMPGASESGPTPPQHDGHDRQRPSPAFVANQITVRGDQGEITIHNLSVEVACGEIFGIGGVDGNGQSELAEALVGIRPHVSGSLSWNGRPYVSDGRPSRGYIPQDRRRNGLAVSLSINENLLFAAVRSPEFHMGPFLRRSALRALAQRLVTEFDIRTADPTQPASSLSGGNQQKIVVARALYSHPEWIVAVNPTRGLDIASTRFVHQQLHLARRRGAAVVLISTDLDELAALADRGAILSCGQLTEYTFNAPDTERLGLLLGGIVQTPSEQEPTK